MRRRKQKARALLIDSMDGEYYIIQIQMRFLFFKWWHTIKQEDYGFWNYGVMRFTKEEVDELLEKFEKLQNNGGEFDVYKEV